jgi:uncharacterized membrane protein YkvA (DUF1232 family)
MQFIYFSVLFKRIKAIRYFMKDKEVPIRKKLIIVAGLIYLIVPIDLIPGVVLGFGFIDDLVLWGFIIYYLKDELDKYWFQGEEPDPLKTEVLKGKDIIDDVDYEVEAEEEIPVKHSK